MNKFYHLTSLAGFLVAVAGAPACSDGATTRTPSAATGFHVPTNLGGESQGGTVGNTPGSPVNQPAETVVCGNGQPCPTGACLLGPSGVTECAVPCADGCSDGWSCKLVASQGEYPVPLCVHLPATQCNPCTNHVDCNQSVDKELNRCVRHDLDGSFCATSCGPDGTTCPYGSTCQEVTGDGGALSQVCLPDSGQCTCSPSAIANALSTPCGVSSEAGTCEGSRSCLPSGLTSCLAKVPAAEACNGVDDDCDGEIDEGVISPCGTCSTTCTFETGMETSDGLGPTQNPYGGAVSDVLTSTQPVIWIANSGENTVSRLNTGTGCEEARFYTGGDPSRTAVDQDASGFIGCRGGGQLMKIATQLDLCVDTNGNGIIDTSTDLSGDCKITPDEMVQNDECIVWKVVPPGASALRGAGIDAEGNVWVGDSNMPALFLLDGKTGATLKQHSISASPYGLAIDSDGIIWVASRSPHSLTRMDPQAGQINSWPVPTGDAYGIAIDPYGKIWVANYSGGGVHRFDPNTNTWIHLGGNGNSGRGVAVRLVYGQDFQVVGAKVYVANSSVAMVDIYDAETVTHEGHINLNGNLSAVGVAIDLEGFLWVVNQGGANAHKIDTGTNTIVGTYPVGSGPYTYSDMTGYAFHTITSLTAVYRHVFEGWSYGQTAWDSVNIFANLPGDTHANVQYRTGDSPGTLKEAEWTEPIGPFPPMAFPLALNVSGKYLEVRALLVAGEGGLLPSYDKMVVQAHQP